MEVVPIYQGSSGAETGMEHNADQAADADHDAEEDEWHDSLDSSEIMGDLSDDDLISDEGAHTSETSARQGEESRATTGDAANEREGADPQGADEAD